MKELWFDLGLCFLRKGVVTGPTECLNQCDNELWFDLGLCFLRERVVLDWVCA